MRLYFHFERGAERVGDEHGMDVPDFDAAERIAVTAAADIAAEDLKRGSSLVDQRVVVTAEDERQLFAIGVEARISHQLLAA